MRTTALAFDCTQVSMAQVEHLQAMIDNAREITLATLRRHCDLREWEEGMGYGPWLRLKNDWCVTFYKSTIRGVPCWYIKHSAIEHVWVFEEQAAQVRQAMTQGALR